MKFGTKLTFILISIGFLPLLLGGFLLFYFFEGYFKEATYRELEEVRDFAFFLTENFLENSSECIDSLSRNPVLISKDALPEEVKEELDVVYENYKQVFREIDILDENGYIIASTRRGDRRDWKDNKWFIEAKEREEAVISDIYGTALSVFCPNFDREGELTSFVVASIDTKFLFRELDFKAWEKGEDMVLVNSDGEIIFHPEEKYLFTKLGESYPLEKSFSKKEGRAEFDFQGEDSVASFRVIEKESLGLKWQVVTILSKEEAFRFLINMAINYIALLVVLLFPIIIISFFITKRIMKPLKSLSFAAKKVGRGDFSAQAEVFSRDEFGELAENFNKMTRELQETREMMEEEKSTLEVKIDARTRELNELNTELENKVQERTREIEEKLREVEKMSKLMVGREMKMVEIKKQLKEAEEEIERLKKEKSKANNNDNFENES